MGTLRRTHETMTTPTDPMPSSADTALTLNAETLDDLDPQNGSGVVVGGYKRLPVAPQSDNCSGRPGAPGC
jgi:hypothetical protein